MNNASTPASPTIGRRLATGIVATTAGALLGVLASTTLINGHASAQPATSRDAGQWGFPGNVTMSADAIEQWIADRVERSTTASTPSSADAAEQWLTPG